MQWGKQLAILGTALLLTAWSGEPLAAAAGPTACDSLLPASAQAPVRRGDMAAKLNAPDVAEKEYRAALTAAPDTPAILYRIALLYADRGNDVAGILYLRAYLEAANSARRPCVPVPAGQIRQAIEDIEVKVESNASNLFQAAIEAVGAAPEEERSKAAKNLVQALALSEKWRLAESVARQYPLGVTEDLANAASIENGPLQIRMFNLAKKIAEFDPPESMLTRAAAEPGPQVGDVEVLPGIQPGQSWAEYNAWLNKVELENKRKREEQDRIDLPKWRISCQATRMLSIAMLEGGRSGWETIVESQELLARQGLHYGSQCFFGDGNMLGMGGNGVEFWRKEGMVLKVAYAPEKIWSPVFTGGLGLQIRLVSSEASEQERRYMTEAEGQKSAVSECAYASAARVHWLDIVQGRLKEGDNPWLRWTSDPDEWTNDGLFVDFSGWVQELTPKSPLERERDLSSGGWRLTKALEELRNCGEGPQ